MDETISTPADPGLKTVGASHRRDILGTLIGLLVFFCGIGLLLITFRLAYDLFTVPPDSALGLHDNKVLNVAQAGNSAALLLLKIFLLLIMAFVGSLVANRGISLYAGARGLHK